MFILLAFENFSGELVPLIFLPAFSLPCFLFIVGNFTLSALSAAGGADNKDENANDSRQGDDKPKLRSGKSNAFGTNRR